jgi:hypothetical protein
MPMRMVMGGMESFSPGEANPVPAPKARVVIPDESAKDAIRNPS